MAVLDNGMRWGECATDEQWADMRALLEPGDGPRRHFWLRSRGRSKTSDAAVATIAVMLCGEAGPGEEMYAAAAGRDQAALLAGKILGISRATPELADALEVQQHRVIARRTGAVLQVMSSELATSWGKTPFWLFVDEICNHDNTPPKEEFVVSQLTSLPKRRDSRCLIGSTPSAVTHWSYQRWVHAESSPLWRASILAGPAPWQDPEELADIQADLPEFQWRRLFLCEWASAEDTVADEQAIDECTRAGSDMAPDPGTEYVVGWDIGWKRDHSAVVVAHLGERGGRSAVITDRLESWVPRPGHPVQIGEVLDFAARMSREYNGALMIGDPREAWQHIQRLSAEGYAVRAADTTAGANSNRAKLLLRLVRDRAVAIPPDEQLRKELLSLRLTEGATPGVVRLTSDGSAQGHHDRVMALMYAAGELLSRPGMSWRNYAGDLRQCENPDCQRWYLAKAAQCTWCQAPNPVAPPAGMPAAGPSRPWQPQPGSWSAALLPPGARKCPEGHLYNGKAHGESCPRCNGPQGQMALPAAFAGALSMIGARR